MIDPNEFVAALEKLDIRFVTGVPDSLLQEVCAGFTAHFAPPRHVIATSEGSAVGLAIGHTLATGRPALVYMQNSGLGNVVNPVVSLADPQAYGIPMIFLIGWRGELLGDGSQLHDEPQHIKQGRVTIPQLEILDIPYRIVDKTATASEPLLTELLCLTLAKSSPVALVVRKGSFSSFRQRTQVRGDAGLTREAAIAAVVAALPDDCPVVATTGMASRELFELRRSLDQGHHRDFLTVGGMGHAGQIAAGLAMAKPSRPVVCIDGDGALLMHMGGLAISADCPNLLHILINNGAHDSVGGQPTKGTVLSFTKIAKACGYGRVALARSTAGIARQVSALLGCGCSSFLEIKCKPGARADLGRPNRSPGQNKREFMTFLEEG